MKAEIISTGTELLRGEITDTNAVYLASQLPLLGIELCWISQVADNQAQLVEMLTRAWQRSDLILTSGGLGPTEDDLTREAIAETLGEKLTVDPTLKQEIEEFFAQRRMKMSPSNLKQATLIASASALHNVRGTAPGWWIEKEGRTLIAMPGPSREMQRMWDKEIQPRLRQRFMATVILARTFKTFGLGESVVGEMMSPLLSQANPSLGVYAKADGIYLRLIAKTPNQQQAEELLDQSEVKIRSILGDYIWGTDSDTLAGVVGNLLLAKGLSLAVMESCTGGLLAATISDAPGSATYFKGGLVAISKEARMTCGINTSLTDDGNGVSREAAQAMAQAARQYLKADIGASTTGIADTQEGEDKPVSRVYIGLDDGKNARVIPGNYLGDRLQVKRRVTTAVLFQLRRMLTAI